MGIAIAVIVVSGLLAIGFGLANAAGEKKGKQIFAAYNARGLEASMIKVFELAGEPQKAANVRQDLGWLNKIRQAQPA